MPKRSLFQLELFPAPEPAPTVVPEPTATPEPEPDPPSDSRERLADRLGELLDRPLASLVLTENRSRIVSARPAPYGRRLEVRIHRCFADASEPTLRAVADFLGGRRGEPRRRALRTIREHFARHGAPQEPATKRRTVLRPVGQCFDLRELCDDVDRRYFGGELGVAITWGRASRRRRKRRRRGCGFSIQLGSYDDRRRLVRIHRCLDRPEVPRYVVEAVIHHELLHAALPPVVVNGRRRLHTPEFRRRERQFEHHRKASRWIEKNLARLAGWR